MKSALEEMSLSLSLCEVFAMSLRTLKRTLEAFPLALAYTDAGLTVPPEEVERLLGETGDAKASHRNVAVNIGNAMPSYLFDYALDTCVRMGAGLVLLGEFGSQGMNQILQPFLPRLADAHVPYEAVDLKGTGWDGLSRYVRTHREVIFTIFKADDLNLATMGKNPRLAERDFPVPMVVVAPQAAA